MKKNRFVLTNILLCTIAILLSAILFNLISTSNDDYTVNNKVVNNNQETSFDSFKDTQDSGDCVAMDKYDIYHYTIEFPEEYREFLLIKNSNSDVVEFYSVIDGVEIPIFSIGFGENLGDIYLGYFEENDTSIPVYLNFYDIERFNSWSDDDYFIVCAMQEAANDVIDSFYSLNNFVKE